MECPPTLAQQWLDDHRGDVLGLPLAEAAALVEAAGLRVRPLRPGDMLAPEAWNDRIDLRPTAGDEVAEAFAG